jgi:hypothetical protein
MKDNAMYRIIAVDHDFVSFTDESLSLPQTPMPVSHDIKISPPVLGTPDASKKRMAPIVLVTNPRDARFAIPKHEPIKRVLTSTHIRLLIWSAVGVNASGITINIDGKHTLTGNTDGATYKGTTDIWKNITDPKAVNHLPLWTIPWKPEMFNDGRDHRMTVTVSDKGGLTTIKTIIFRIDGQQATSEDMGSGTGGKVAGMNFNSLVRIIFLARL